LYFRILADDLPMQPASTAPHQHRRLARLNAFIERQNRIIYVLLIVTASIGLAWVIWRHQYIIYRDQHQPKTTQVEQQAPSERSVPR
jgi:hypothetical protein